MRLWYACRNEIDGGGGSCPLKKVSLPFLPLKRQNPQNTTFSDLQNLWPLAKHYVIDIKNFKSELKLIPKVIQRRQTENKTEIKTLFDFINF